MEEHIIERTLLPHQDPFVVTSGEDSIEYLVVAGGGGGGFLGGGGGAGGFRTNTEIITPSTYQITIGAGGVGSRPIGGEPVPGTHPKGIQGGDTTFNGGSPFSAGGGGGGGSYNSPGSSNNTGDAGGSGGGCW